MLHQFGNGKIIFHGKLYNFLQLNFISSYINFSCPHRISKCPPQEVILVTPEHRSFLLCSPDPSETPYSSWQPSLQCSPSIILSHTGWNGSTLWEPGVAIVTGSLTILHVTITWAPDDRSPTPRLCGWDSSITLLWGFRTPPGTPCLSLSAATAAT